MPDLATPVAMPATTPAQRPATIDDIVRRLAGSTYEWTAIHALGWGMGPAQLDISKAVQAAEAAGFVTTATIRGKRSVQLARRIVSVTAIGDARIFVYDQPGAYFPYAVDSFRLPTADEIDPDQVDPRQAGELVLVEQLGDYTAADIPRMVDDAVDYLQAQDIISAEDVADRAAHAAASYVRRVAAVGVIGRARGRTVTTVRTAEGVTGTVTAAVR